MPGQDRTGPMGEGPGTGKRLGPCLDPNAPVPGYAVAEDDPVAVQPPAESLPAVNDVVTKVDTEAAPGKAVITFESGKSVTVDITHVEPITASITVTEKPAALNALKAIKSWLISAKAPNRVSIIEHLEAAHRAIEDVPERTATESRTQQALAKAGIRFTRVEGKVVVQPIAGKVTAALDDSGLQMAITRAHKLLKFGDLVSDPSINDKITIGPRITLLIEKDGDNIVYTVIHDRRYADSVGTDLSVAVKDVELGLKETKTIALSQSEDDNKPAIITVEDVDDVPKLTATAKELGVKLERAGSSHYEVYTTRKDYYKVSNRLTEEGFACGRSAS